MSTQSSVISGLAGAVIASAAWYFTSNKQEATPAESGQETTANKEMVASVAMPEDSCTIRKDHAITWQEAQALTGAYLNTPNKPQLIAPDGSTLKGWYIDKCVIEDLFRLYPESDGLQLYVALKTPEGANPYHDLVWVASQMVKVGNQMERMNCNSEAYSVMDYTGTCPTVCPTRNPLPN